MEKPDISANDWRGELVRLRRAACAEGRPLDILRYGLTREEFDASEG